MYQLTNNVAKIENKYLYTNNVSKLTINVSIL